MKPSRPDAKPLSSHALSTGGVKSATAIALLVALVAAAAVCSLMFGVRSISASDALGAMTGSTSTAGEAAAAGRIPRTALAMSVGAALAAAGTTLQAVTRNPLADPGIFGILAGAALAVSAAMAFTGLSRPAPTMAVAVVGAFAAAAFVYAVGSLGRGGATPLKLALSGAATAAALSSLTSAVILPREDVMDRFRFWQIGSVGGAEWSTLAAAAPLLVIGAVIVWLSASGLNALALGDEAAAGLGVPVGRTRLFAVVGAVILCGTAVAVAGPIGFVGLIVPHTLRLLLGTDHTLLVPASFLGGAVILTAADTLGRVVGRPSEIAVGIITPLLGAPLFIWLARRAKGGGL